MLYWTLPGETEGGTAGEQPSEGYLGQAHQTMSGRGVIYGVSPCILSSDDRPVMPQKTREDERCQSTRKVPDHSQQDCTLDSAQEVPIYADDIHP